jgi:hypothetical protein
MWISNFQETLFSLQKKNLTLSEQFNTRLYTYNSEEIRTIQIPNTIYVLK